MSRYLIFISVYKQHISYVNKENRKLGKFRFQSFWKFLVLKTLLNNPWKRHVYSDIVHSTRTKGCFRYDQQFSQVASKTEFTLLIHR